MRSYALAALPMAAQALEFANNLLTVDDNRAIQVDGIVKFPVDARAVTGLLKSKNGRRQTAVDLTNEAGTAYLITLAMGTPAQTVTVDFDTGSNELWVNPDCSTAPDKEFCEGLGRYQRGSSTAVDLKTSGGVQYGKGEVKFDYFKDTISIGSAKIVGQQFGVGSYSNDLSNGIMGAGPDLRGFDRPEYPMVIDSLAKQGLINGRAFSVDLREVSSPRGAVIFGGADTKKFTGKLAKSPIIEGPDGAARYWINMEGLTVNAPDGTTIEIVGGKQNLKKIPIFPDTGATLGHLPLSIVKAVAAGFPGAEWNAQYNLYTVPCSLTKEKKTVDFTFGAATIKVPFSDFIWQAGTDTCVMGVVPSADGDQSYSLGDSFLRAAYAVFDQDNKNVWLAQGADCGTNLVSFGSGPNAITALEGDCGKPPVTSSSTTTTTTTTTSSTTTSSSTKTTTTTASSTTTKSSSTTTSSTPTKSSSTTTSSTPTKSSSSTTSSSTKSSSSSSSVPTGTGVTTSSSSTGTGITTSGVPTTGITTSIPWSNTTTAAPTYTSTYLTTTTYTITACPTTVTNCPVGRVTTEIITAYTTWCPGEATATNQPPQPTGKCPGPECNKPTPGNQCPGPNCNKPTPGGEQPGSQCPGPNCTKPTSSAPGEGKPTTPAGNKCPGGPNCPPQPTSSGKPTTPAGSKCPGGANCPQPTGGMTTVSKPCATCGGVATSTPTNVVTGAASEMFRVSGFAAAVAAMAALIL